MAVHPLKIPDNIVNREAYIIQEVKELGYLT